jgi:hypothetical protein
MMKMTLVAMVLILSACAPAQHQSTAWNMSYSCNGNIACINNFHATGGSGSFSSESDCLVWETGFLNSFGLPRVSCSACTGN